VAAPAPKPHAAAAKATPIKPARSSGVLAVAVPAPKPAPPAKPAAPAKGSRSAEEREAEQLLAKSKTATGDSL